MKFIKIIKRLKTKYLLTAWSKLLIYPQNRSTTTLELSLVYPSNLRTNNQFDVILGLDIQKRPYFVLGFHRKLARTKTKQRTQKARENNGLKVLSRALVLNIRTSKIVVSTSYFYQ